jgi:phosphoglycerate dehydrogenase-like enzyme
LDVSSPVTSKPPSCAWRGPPADGGGVRLRNTSITPHLVYVTEETYRVFFGQALEDIKAYLGGTPLRVLPP